MGRDGCDRNCVSKNNLTFSSTLDELHLRVTAVRVCVPLMSGCI